MITHLASTFLVLAALSFPVEASRSEINNPIQTYTLPSGSTLNTTQPSEAGAQSDTLRADLEAISIVSTRSNTALNRVPFSVSSWQRSEPARLISPASNLSATLTGVPGVYLGNRENFSLGERLSIRGMGWRASFGVRGIQVMLNGIPLTSPDGQTILEVIDPNMIRTAEIIRGPNAVFWGNGSGGTVYLRTDTADEGTSLRYYTGSYGSNGQDLTAAYNLGKTRIQADVSTFQTDGYRNHSRARLNRTSLQLTRTLDARSTLSYTGFAAHAPYAENPGSMDLQTTQDDRQWANPLFVQRDAGKDYTHIMQGVRYTRETEGQRFETVIFGTLRDLRNPILPSIIEIDRLSAGGRINYQVTRGAVSLLLSGDIARQSDDRRNWINDQGQKGAATVDQTETTTALGTAAIAQYQRGALTLSGGLRYDAVDFRADDHLSGDPGLDASGSRTLYALTPQVGLTYELNTLTLFGGISSGFETPTTTELVNRPDLQRGFNPDLQPERSRSYETGIRGHISPARLRYEVSIYQIDVRDRLSAYQTEAGGDRNFFENTGSSRHRGVELALQWRPLPITVFTGTFAEQDFIFNSDEAGVQGNHLPGIPLRMMQVHAAYEGDYLMADLSLTHHGKMYANNANTVDNPAWTSLDAGVSREFKLGTLTLIPFLRVSNILDHRFNASVSINAFGGRFFEPALPRNFTCGVVLQIP